MRLSVIVPARNEADVLRPCLDSLLAQSEAGFLLGEDWELLMVDDGSTDETRSIALGLAPAVTLLDPEPLKAGWTGKANALWSAAGKAQGEWLLFTDADTIHVAGNLQRAMHEADHAQVVMLSYSPRQLVTGFWQRALMPLIFSELALRLSAGKGLRSVVAHGGRQWAIPDGPANRLLSGGWSRGGGRLPAGGRRPGVPAQASESIPSASATPPMR